MGLFDSISSIFGGGSSTAGAGGYTGTPDPWLAVIGQLASSFKATPRAGASEKDRNKASMMNMFGSLLGSGLTAYSAQQDQAAKQQAMNELMGIYQRGGNPNMQGPVMPGQAPLDQGLTESVFGWGQKNPGLAPLSMELGLKARETDRDTQRWEQDRQFKIGEANRNYELDKLKLGQEQAYRNANLGIENRRLAIAEGEAKRAREATEASAPYTMARNLKGVLPDDVYAEVASQILARTGTIPTPGATPTTQPNQDMTSVDGGGAAPNVSNPLSDLFAASSEKKKTKEQVERIDKITTDSTFNKQIEETNKAQTSFRQLGEVLNNIKQQGGEIFPQDQVAMAKLMIQTIEPGLSVNEGEAAAALKPTGEFNANSDIAKILARVTGSNRFDLNSIERAFTNMGGLVNARKDFVNRLISQKQKYASTTGVTNPELLGLIGQGYVDLGDPMEYANTTLQNFKAPQIRGINQGGASGSWQGSNRMIQTPKGMARIMGSR